MRQASKAVLVLISAMLAASCGDDGDGKDPAAATHTPLPVSTPTHTLTPAPTATPPQRVSSDLAAASNGGGCYPQPITLSSPLDMLPLVNPEWAPVINGQTVDSEPVVVHGVIRAMHGNTGGDFPATHNDADYVAEIELDPADRWRAASGNPEGEMALEWEAGITPPFAWAGEGDRVTIMGRWIFDCGHPDARPGHCSGSVTTLCVLDSDCGAQQTCVGAHFNYSSEIHPPQATAVIRSGRGGGISATDATVKLATRADVYVSPNGGGAGDRCVLTHLPDPADLLGAECYPLSEPVAPINRKDFTFDMPLPPKPAAGGHPIWRIVERPIESGERAVLEITPHTDDTAPHLELTVKMTQPTKSGPPAGYAGTIYAGWDSDTTPLTHVRVTIDSIVIHNALQLKTPISPKTCSGNNAPCSSSADCPNRQSCLGIGPVKRWRGQAAINGEWQSFFGLVEVSTGNVIPQGLVYDQYLPAGATLRVQANGVSDECISAMLGKSIPADIEEQGFNRGVSCLLTLAGHSPGDVEASYDAPDFGAGSGSMEHETRSEGGEGGACSVTTSELCIVDADCPASEKCVRTGGAFSLRYRIERLPN